MARLNECSDVKIGKELKVWKERVRQLKSNLHTKCKRLGINFNI
jgi:DNA-directed RNA polymerase sigma subunit (sigma70/sigma32)